MLCSIAIEWRSLFTRHLGEALGTPADHLVTER